MKIGLDVDEVCANLTDHYLNFINIQYGTRYGKSAINDWEYVFPNGLQAIDAINRILMDYGQAIMIPPNEGFKKGYWQLFDEGHSVTFITSRKRECHYATFQWLRHHTEDEDLQLIMHNDKCCHGFNVLVDDNFKHIWQFAHSPKNQAILYTAPWNSVERQTKEYKDYNQTHDNITEVSNWNDIVNAVLLVSEIKSMWTERNIL
jgi:5'(3')-deoxyribonucleotidase